MKKINIIITILFVFFYFSGFSQLKVASDGKVGIGIGTTTPNSDLSIGSEGNTNYALFSKGDNYGSIYAEGISMGLYAKRTGSASSSWLYAAFGSATVTASVYSIGTRGECYSAGAEGSGRAWGVLGKAGNSTSGYNYGVFGTTLGTQNGAGIVGTTNSNTDIQIPGVYAGYFDGNMKVTGLINGVTVGSSDMRLKQNIIGLETSIPASKGVTTLNTVLQMMPVEYNLQQQYQESKGDSATVKKALYDETSQLFQKKHFGLVAQDLQKLYPELVYKADDGFLSINYTGIIPLLIQSIKELKTEVDGLKSSGGTEEKSALLTNETEAKLYQNAPNPFDSNTTINFEIPESVQNAQLYILNMNGNLLKTLQIHQRGAGDEIINGNEYNAGMYLYSLVCDGKIVDTKQMLLTK